MARPHTELAHLAALTRGPLSLPGWPATTQATVLSEDPDDGAISVVLHLAPGYRRPAGTLACAQESFVLGGSLHAGSTVRGVDAYDYHPAGSHQEEWVVSGEGCEMLLKLHGPAELVPAATGTGLDGVISLDTGSMPWQVTPIPGPPPGITLKVLREVASTGEFTALVANPPRWDYPALEYHDCVEEVYCITGDISLGNSGTMTQGSYFWRPPYITHGPFYSHSGVVFFLWVPSTLVNHYVDDPRRTIEENRREAGVR